MRLSQFACCPTERFPKSHAANLAVLDDGTLALVCFRGSSEGAADSVATMQTLGADGKWSRPRVLAQESGLSVGNSVLMPLAGGRAILFYTLSYAPGKLGWDKSLIHYRLSQDNAATWGERRTVTEELGFICRNPGVVLSNGDWLLPIYDNRGGNRPGYEGMGGNEGSVIVSCDEGRSWRRFGRMVAGCGLAQPTVVELGGGRLLAYLRTRNFWNGEDPAWAYIYRSESFDFGRNWTHPQPTQLPNNNSSIQMIRLAGGALALAYNHQAGRYRSPLNIALSYDDGATWPVTAEIEAFAPDGSEFSYPAIAHTPDGLIHLAYTWKRTHIKHVALRQEDLEEARPLAGPEGPPSRATAPQS